MKIEELMNNLDRILSWRKKEIVNLENDLKSKLNSIYYLRVNYALIYAHYEGACRDIFDQYLRYINSILKSENFIIKSKNYFIIYLIIYRFIDNYVYNNVLAYCAVTKDLVNAMKIDIGDALDIVKKEFSKVIDDKQRDFKDHIINLLDNKSFKPDNIKIKQNTIKINSNLNYNRLTNLLWMFNVGVDDIISIQKERIEQILKYRNKISHSENETAIRGSDLDKSIDAAVKTNSEIINLIEYIKDKVIENAKDICLEY